MSTWTNEAKWNLYKSEQGCPVCNQKQDDRPPGEHHIATLRVSRLIADRNTCMKGHCCLVSRPHAVELHDLSEDDATAFMLDIQQAACALQSITKPVKVNYEIYGNSIPHLHLHLWPRQIGDKFEGAPIDWRTKSPDIYQDGEIEAFVSDMQRALGQSCDPK